MSPARPWPPGQPTLKARVCDAGSPHIGGTVTETGPYVVAVRWDDPQRNGLPSEQYVPIDWLRPLPKEST